VRLSWQYQSLYVVVKSVVRIIDVFTTYALSARFGRFMATEIRANGGTDM